MIALQSQLSIEMATGLRPGRARWEGLVAKLEELLAEGYPSGLALAIVERKGATFRAWGGFACVVGEVVPLQRDTLFDLASLTKVLASAPLALLFAQRGEWSLQDPVGRWVPGFPLAEVTLMHLLTHTSGLVAHRPFFVAMRGRAAFRRAVLVEATNAAPPGEVVYSDLNYMLLGWALEACGGARLDRLVRRELTIPLGMSQTRFVPPPTLRRRCAATEADGDQRNEPGLIWGEVHDGNAAALGGIAGHAGLFAPLDDLVNFTAALLHPSSHPVLSEASIEMFSREMAAVPGDVRSIGWRLVPQDWGVWASGTYWHTGFTGTSVLVDPATGVAVVLLMNGVHPVRRPEEQSRVRAELHTTIAEACQ